MGEGDASPDNHRVVGPRPHGNGFSDAYRAVSHILGEPTDDRPRRPGGLSVHVRYVRFLFWEFRWPLGVFALLVLGGGLILHHFYGREEVSYGRAFYAVFLMIFLESGLEFPDEWYLQPLFFLVPIVGLGALADSVVRLAYLMFTKKQRLPEWQRIMASLYRKQIVVVGVWRVGLQVIKGLRELGEHVVAVHPEPDPDPTGALLDELYELGIPVIRGNVRAAKTLSQAGVPHASAVIVTTGDDLTNLDVALTARDLNPGARIVVRLFDETLAGKVAGAFAMPTISTAHVSAPAFIAAATGRKVYQEFVLAGQSVHLTDLAIAAGGGLVGKTVGAVQSELCVNIVMHQGSTGQDLNPQASVVLHAGDLVLVIAAVDRLLKLEALNRSETSVGKP
jgi:Trk K+ transport system NAD-binding subunit